jgi:hypothetical protein
MSKSQIQMPTTAFFNIKGTVRFEFIPQDNTANKDYYAEIMKWLSEAVRGKRPELWPNDRIIHYDNSPAHKVLSSSFWPQNRLLKWNTHPVPLIWLRMTCGCFQK